MELFWGIFFAFPVIIFSTLLTLCVLYWLVAAIGIFSVDCLDVDIDGIDSELPSTGLGGLLMKFGFHEVPMTLIITLISLFGWAMSYFACRFMLIHLYELPLIYYLVGVIAFIVTLLIAIYLTAWVIKPIRPFFSKLNGVNNHQTLIGQTVEIRSSSVSITKGEAIYEDGGAGLILQVRADESCQFKRGDKAVLLSYNVTHNSYEIISIEAFNGY